LLLFVSIAQGFQPGPVVFCCFFWGYMSSPVHLLVSGEATIQGARLGAIGVQIGVVGHGRLQLELGCPIAPHEAFGQALHDSRVSVGVVKTTWQLIAPNVVFAVIASAVLLEHRPRLCSTGGAKR